MEEHMKRVITVVAVAVAAVALAGCGGDDEATTTTTDTTATTETQTLTDTQTETQTETTEPDAGPTVVRVTVRDGVPVGGVQRATVTKGDRVALVVRSDVADEIHLHGYDLSRDVEAGGQARIVFTADVPGRFEVELEERRTPIAELTVEP
jgi:hypothetical protein